MEETRGRKPIPQRSKKPIATFLRLPVDDVVRARAKKMGMSMGEYVSYLVANGVGMPEHAPALPENNDPQEALDIDLSA